MNQAEYTKMAEFENDYWWHQGKVHLVTTLVESMFPGRKDLKILEIGCGTGGVTKSLTEYGDVTGIDTSADALEYCRKLGLTNILQADINEMDLSEYQGKFDLVLALDVLEHIQDDLETMRRVRRLLNKGGLFLINVPAYKFLWSEHDEALHHKRRYHSLELTTKLKDSGFKIVKRTYFVAAVFPVMVIYRMLGNFFRRSAYPKTSYVILPKFLNNLMVKVLSVEAAIARRAALPVGATLTVVAGLSEE
jgi:SAM-dependent methyltransferase